MNRIGYEERKGMYLDALTAYGTRNQLIVAVEELSECQKEICKVLRGDGNQEHMAEEVADATIMLEQIRLMFNINDCVCKFMDEKIKRLDDRVKGSMKNVKSD